MTPTVPPPLDPTSEQARSWLERELSQGKYHASPSLFQRFLDWLDSLFRRAGSGPGLPSWLVPVVVLVVVAVIALILWRVLRREPAAADDGWGAVLEDETLSAAEVRERARGHAAAGRPEAAVLDAYRAIVLSATERTLLDDLPGRTAREAAVALGPVFPGERDALLEAGRLFDDVRYGGGRATADDARRVLALDERLQATRPILADAVPA